MKYVKLFENTPVIGNSMIKFTSKNDKLDQIKGEINSILTGNKIGYNYATGSKGIYFTNNNDELIDDNGYGCTTYSELLSNLEAILFALKNINNVSSSMAPIKADEVLPPTNDIVPTIDNTILIPVVGDEIESFESFISKI